MDQSEKRLSEFLDALDVQLPFVRYQVRRFPEGEEFLRLSVPGAARSTVFIQDGEWICLSETASDVTLQRALGSVEEQPEAVVGRLSFPVRVPPPLPRGIRLVRAVGFGLAAAVGTAVLAAVVLTVLVFGNGYGYGSDAVHWTINTLAIVCGAVVGGWVGRRSWRARRLESRKKEGTA
ncbi:hypothetical protein [Nonomuraea africana]|uniref:Uncharacterized protein n=1 Tax=Nonomuraea africana TaxID=46171 RepID=A0ABR9KIW7_9ACTN|nr:hypothetical protein [Nonomuraea africana]MBE1561910.1 hypothetical protein [Nonomuraea africana]